MWVAAGWLRNWSATDRQPWLPFGASRVAFWGFIAAEEVEEAVDGDDEDDDDDGERFSVCMGCEEPSPTCCERRMLSRFLRASRAMSQTVGGWRLG